MILFIGIVLLFFASVFYRNLTTFYSMKRNAGYTLGRIDNVRESKGSWMCSYHYTVNGNLFSSVQGEKRQVNDTVLILYDTTAPRFSMIVEYPLPSVRDSAGSLTNLDTLLVHCSYWDYLPAGEIKSIKDIWSLD